MKRTIQAKMSRPDMDHLIVEEKIAVRSLFMTAHRTTALNSSPAPAAGSRRA
jgi:hypothetical protein